jgi:hypothetical protein
VVFTAPTGEGMEFTDPAIEAIRTDSVVLLFILPELGFDSDNLILRDAIGKFIEPTKGGKRNIRGIVKIDSAIDDVMRHADHGHTGVIVHC